MIQSVVVKAVVNRVRQQRVTRQQGWVTARPRVAASWQHLSLTSHPSV